jgi:hypothetical protein
MLTRDNYSYKKYQKELAKKKKREEKMQSKLDKKNKANLALPDGKCAAEATDSGQAPNEDVTVV